MKWMCSFVIICLFYGNIASSDPTPQEIEQPTNTLTQEQKQEKERYLEQALQNYDEILKGQENPKPNPNPKKDFYAPQAITSNLTPEQRQEQNKYLEEALHNYDEILDKTAMAGNPQKKLWEQPPALPPTMTPEQRKNQSSYLEEALKNYEELLSREMEKEEIKKRNAIQADKEWKEKRRKLLEEYYQEALKNYDEILDKQDTYKK